MRAGARAAAEELAGTLRSLGFSAAVCAEGREGALYTRDLEERPCVVVSAGAGRRVHGSEFVYVVPDGRAGQGRLCFWWSSGAPLAPADDVGGAASAIVRDLPCPDADCVVCELTAEEG